MIDNELHPRGSDGRFIYRITTKRALVAIDPSAPTKFSVQDDCRNGSVTTRTLNVRFPFSDELAGHMRVPVTSRVVMRRVGPHTCEF